jgi:hypothetical protein
MLPGGLRLHEEHNTLISFARQMISGIGPLAEEGKRIEEELDGWQKEARTLGASRPANAALRATALLAIKLGTFSTSRRGSGGPPGAPGLRGRGVEAAVHDKRGRLSGRPFSLEVICQLRAGRSTAFSSR